MKCLWARPSSSSLEAGSVTEEVERVDRMETRRVDKTGGKRFSAHHRVVAVLLAACVVAFAEFWYEYASLSAPVKGTLVQQIGPSDLGWEARSSSIKLIGFFPLHYDPHLVEVRSTRPISGWRQWPSA